MTADEFDETVLRGKNGSVFVCDVRPFGNRQAEAVDYYLNDLIARLERGEFAWLGAESIAVWCNQRTCFQFSTIESYRKLWRAGYPIKIEERRE